MRSKIKVAFCLLMALGTNSAPVLTQQTALVEGHNRAELAPDYNYLRSNAQPHLVQRTNAEKFAGMAPLAKA
jgi:hypothetical protein